MQLPETHFTQNLESESQGMVTKNVRFNKLPRDVKCVSSFRDHGCIT